jgi:hypothetical protein
MALRGALDGLLMGGLALSGGSGFENKQQAAAPVELTLGPVAVANTGENYICATTDWWPPNKCDYGVCPWGDTPHGNPSIPNLDIKQPAFM